ncbi:MAG TPA: UDP-N-acetylmuramate--L-alanine ligase [Thermomicrobiales bacterium]|nr:UDP-N-acetylmuramate--L-alanine ligase [Thermomicrobiales bacterium]
MSRHSDQGSLPPVPARVHFVGIGGVSMSGLARVLRDGGYTVSGSDSSESATVAQLRDDGIEIVKGHDDPTLASKASVLVSTPRAADHAPRELDAARSNGALMVRRGQLLGMIANPRHTIAVGGTHGKSTTTGMIATALIAMDQDPGFAVGASLPGVAHSTSAGTGPFMVVEADEFDRAFHWLQPACTVITTVSFDHPDIYVDQSDYDTAFVTFASLTKGGGTLVIGSDDPGCQRVASVLRSAPGLPYDIVTFGEHHHPDWLLSRGEAGWRFTGPDGQAFDAHLSVPGRHNARNAIAAVAALTSQGFDPVEVIAGIEAFTGVGRRFEHKGVIRGIDIVDDYAHHPEEIAAVLSAARERFPGRRIIAVHQPHTFSRTKSLLPEFAASLDLADHVVLLDIYPSGETDTLGISSDDVLRRINVPALSAAGPDDAAAKTAAIAREGDVIMTLGAGDITQAGAELLSLLASGHDHAAPVRTDPAPGTAKAATPSIPGAPHLKVNRDAKLSLSTTMRIGGPADFLVRAPTPDDLVAVAAWANDEGMPLTIIGGGSNLLVGDDGIRGVVAVARTPGERAEQLLHAEDRDEIVRVIVGAQAPLSWVGRTCAEHGWSGMDWGVGLPGQIGGATVNNAGAHGTELKDHLVEVELLLADGKVERQSASWLNASYRMTRIKGAPRPRGWIVLRSVFDLRKGDSTSLVAMADEHAAFRKRTQPTGACSGSTFANPSGDFAGRLLEAAGLKGYQIGAMQFSPKHANWVVNTGNGRAVDAWELIQFGRQRVLDQFGVDLRPEIERVGEPWDT